MKKILVPTDLSPVAECACTLAQKMAKKLEAEIHLLYVLDQPIIDVLGAEEGMITGTYATRSNFLQERDNAEKEIKLYAQQKNIQSFSVQIGNIVGQIISATNAEGIELVVMGTSGAAGLKEFLTGSHAQRIVRKSKVPVITIKKVNTPKSIKSVVFVHNFLEKEQINIKPLKKIALATNSTIHLLQIVTPDCFETNRDVKSAMKKFAEQHALDIDERHFHLYCDGNISKGILHFGLDHNIDMVAMATHQRKGITKLFHHSIAEEVINHNEQIILTFPV